MNRLLLFGLAAELVIFFIAFSLNPSLEETFRYAARYSGRLSAFVFLGAFYLFAMSHPKPIKDNAPLRNGLALFAVLHLIHFGFLASNIYLNDITLVPHKLAGGALAYLMIVAAPFLLYKLKFWQQLVYFYYVALVMIITYITRAKGDFEGADPSWFHFLMLGVFMGSALLFGWRLAQKSRKST